MKTMIHRGIIGAGAALASLAASAQPLPRTYLVRNLTIGGYSSANPQWIVDAGGGSVYFSARHITQTGLDYGRELCRSDGTFLGTEMIRDIQSNGDSDPHDLVRLGHWVLFSAAGTGTDRELWRTDGSSAGTVRVRDIAPGTVGSNPEELTVMGGYVYFSAGVTLGGSGRELWRSDGTSAGTSLVKDIRPGAAGSAPQHFRVVQDVLYFAANDGVHGVELWRSDGTATGTYLVRDIAVDDCEILGSDPTELTEHNGVLYFSADSGDVNPECSNGTGRELWRSDGTPGGTVMVANLGQGIDQDGRPTNLTSVGAILYFVARNESCTFGGPCVTHGRELWFTQGNLSAILLEDIWPGETSSSPANAASDGETRLYFSAGDPTGGRELWTAQALDGARRIMDLRPGTDGSTPGQLFATEDHLFFAADASDVYGRELWHMNLSDESPRMLKDLNSGPDSSGPQNFVLSGRRVFFSANGGSVGRELYAAHLGRTVQADFHTSMSEFQSVLAANNLSTLATQEFRSRLPEDAAIWTPDPLDEFANNGAYLPGDVIPFLRVQSNVEPFGLAGPQPRGSNGLLITGPGDLTGGMNNTVLAGDAMSFAINDSLDAVGFNPQPEPPRLRAALLELRLDWTPPEPSVVITAYDSRENHAGSRLVSFGDLPTTVWLGVLLPASDDPADGAWLERVNVYCNATHGPTDPAIASIRLYTPACTGDVDGDLDVDLADLTRLLSGFGIVGDAQRIDGDLDADGDIDLSDLTTLLASFGTSCA